MTAIIVLLAIVGSIALGLIAMAVWMYHDGHQDNEYWELFHDHDHDHRY
jgi:hypothetical protein